MSKPNSEGAHGLQFVGDNSVSFLILELSAPHLSGQRIRSESDIDDHVPSVSEVVARWVQACIVEPSAYHTAYSLVFV